MGRILGIVSVLLLLFAPRAVGQYRDPGDAGTSVMVESDTLAGDTLVAQSIIGAALAITLTVTF
ncbi:MAG: hypothetical protein RBU27_08240 [Bacteroidota bacterium]|jgi:hypothetical protein|nr:hypothetical protein [Bacteroidota bacterium]